MHSCILSMIFFSCSSVYTEKTSPVFLSFVAKILSITYSDIIPKRSQIKFIFCYQKEFTITFQSLGLSCQWWSDSIFGACMTLHAPFRRRSSRQAVLDLYTGKDMHVCTDPHTHIFVHKTGGNSSSQEFLGNFCSTSQANEISGDCGDRVAIVGFIQCGSSSSLHCLEWKVLSWRLDHWPAGVLLSSPLAPDTVGCWPNRND